MERERWNERRRKRMIDKGQRGGKGEKKGLKERDRE